MLRTKDGWKCAEHAGSNKPVDRPLSSREEAADYESRQNK